MRAFHIDRFDDPSGLVIREHDVPSPGPNEVLLRIHAASLNPRDLMILNRTYPAPGHDGVIPLSDGAGEVVAVGDAVSRVAIGDRVSSTYFLGHVDGPLTYEHAGAQLGATLDGMLTEFRVLHEEWVQPLAPHLSFVEGSTLPCAALTAWSAVHGDHGLVGPDDTVLVLSSGAVGLFAIQFAAARGARVIGATSSAEKAKQLRGIGAAEVVDYRATPDWHKEVLELTGGLGANHVVENVGPRTLEQSIRATALNGHIAGVGVFPAGDASFDLNVFLGRLFTLRRIGVGNRSGLAELNRFMAEHGIRPVVDQVFDFAEAPAAYEHMIGRRHLGKVVISV